MSSFKQIAANRRNALKSTGPMTLEGKQRSRCNGLRHGLTAETVIGVLEDANDYEAFEAAVTADYNAESAVERELVLRLASVLWRLRRATGIETALFESVTKKPHKPPRPIFGPASHRSYRDLPENVQVTSIRNDQRSIQKNIADGFLRLAEQPTRPMALLTRYEHTLWRQARQIVSTLRSLRRNRSAVRRGALPVSFPRADFFRQ
jgi:hypothetical protein